MCFDPLHRETNSVSDEQSRMLGEMTAHNSAQLKKFFENAAIEGDWQLVFAASYNGCIISLPAKGGGQVRLRVAARHQNDTPYLELRAERMGGAGAADRGERPPKRGAGDAE